MTSQKQALTDATGFFNSWEATPEEQEKSMMLIGEMLSLTAEDLAKLDRVTTDK